MNKIKFLFFDILIVISMLYFSYEYFMSNVFVKTRGQFETEYQIKVQNPLAIIFVGRDYSEPHRYSDHNPIERASCLVELTFWLLIITGGFRYYLTKRKRYRILLFCLLVKFWLLISFLAFIPFYKLFRTFYPEYISAGLGNISLKLFIQNILVLAGLYYIIKFLHSTIVKSQSVDFKIYKLQNRWMRGFHFLVDRSLLIILGFNIFLFYYFHFKYGHNFLGIPQNVLFNWGVISYEVAMLMCYLLIEGLFHFSPGKVLTNTIVVETDSTNLASWISILKRSLVRSIPLEFLSFFSISGWHDCFSNTSLGLLGSENWLARFTKIIKWQFVFYLFVVIWFFVTSALQIRDNYNDIYEHISALPLLLVMALSPFSIALFVCWIASISNYFENLASKKFCDNNSHFGMILLWWIPIFYFILPKNTMLRINENYMEINSDNKKNLSQSKLFCRLFSFFYSILLLSVLLYFASNNRIVVAVAMCVCSVALAIFCIAVLLYAKNIQSITNKIN